MELKVGSVDRRRRRRRTDWDPGVFLREARKAGQSARRSLAGALSLLFTSKIQPLDAGEKGRLQPKCWPRAFTCVQNWRSASLHWSIMFQGVRTFRRVKHCLCSDFIHGLAFLIGNQDRRLPCRLSPLLPRTIQSQHARAQLCETRSATVVVPLFSAIPPHPSKPHYHRHLIIGMFGEVNLSPLEHSASKTPGHVAQQILFCSFFPPPI